jgi:hypothetical protein
VICSVCGKEGAAGVFASRIAPVSCAYCQSCLNKGAEPYGVLVTHIAHIRSLQPGYQLSPVLEMVKEATLPIAGKSEEMLMEDVREKLKEF